MQVVVVMVVMGRRVLGLNSSRKTVRKHKFPKVPNFYFSSLAVALFCFLCFFFLTFLCNELT